MNKQKTSTPAATAVLNRVLRYMLHYYKVPFALVIVCIVITAIATVAGSTFPQTLVDDYITPMLESGSRDFSGLARDLTRLACIMGIGVVAAFSYNRIMVSVSQGTMRRLRNELFSKMESLPIKYFDTHAHGDIMSAAAAAQSEHSPDHQLRHYHGGHTGDHDRAQSHPDHHLLADGCGDADGHQEFLQALRQVLCPAAAGPGHCGRLYRGDAGRAESGQGILP